MNKDILNKLEKFQTELIGHGKVLIALSGGVDSCLAAYLARKFLTKENAVAVISNSASLKQKDFDTAINFCKKYDVKYEIIYTREMENENYTSNPANRCYFCKSELYNLMTELAANKYKDYKIINGNNYSDLGDYRPGLKASAELNAASPFINCEITKNDIRELALYFGLPVWNKPASPCLSSRFPYGQEITKEKLKQVENAEKILNDFGFEDVRVRNINNSAKIEVPKNMMNKLEDRFEHIKEKILMEGFTSCTIDDEGLISGKLNRAL
ncbi:MAG: ATP-dependent sacrificial sulfur transferase LarE [Ignavibacteria bacterium]